MYIRTHIRTYIRTYRTYIRMYILELILECILELILELIEYYKTCSTSSSRRIVPTSRYYLLDNNLVDWSGVLYKKVFKRRRSIYSMETHTPVD